MRREKWLFSTMLAISLVLAGCSTGGAESSDSAAASSSAAKAEVEQVITVTNSGELGTLDNALAPDISSMVVIGNAIEGLYRIGADGALELGIASEEPSVSEDGLEYTFKIKEDANWSNGDPGYGGGFCLYLSKNLWMRIPALQM